MWYKRLNVNHLLRELIYISFNICTVQLLFSDIIRDDMNWECMNIEERLMILRLIVYLIRAK